ncbi:MAG: Gldg family protein [Planctomycetota bacterium]
MFDVLAFPNIEPFQTALVVAGVLHLVSVTALVIRRGHPVWLGMVCGFLPGIGLIAGAMLPREAVTDEDRQAASGPGPWTFGAETAMSGLLLSLAAVPLIIRLFAPGTPIIDQHIGVYLCLFVGLLVTLLIGIATRNSRIQVIVQRSVLVLCLGFLLLVLIERMAIRWDMTAEHRYSLDPATRALLEKLPQRAEKLSITYYYSPRSLRPHRLAQLPEEVGEMLEEYRRVAPDHIRIQLVEVPQKVTSAKNEDDAGFGIGGGFSTKDDEAKRRALEEMSAEEKARTELLELIRRRSIEEVEEERIEGTRRVKVSYYSSFWVSYGQQPGDRINDVTVSREEESVGKRAVDQANYQLTNLIRQMVLSALGQSQPFTIRRFSADGTSVQFVDDATWYKQGEKELKHDGKNYLLSVVDAKAATVTVQAVDAGSKPEVLRQAPLAVHKVGFLSGHGVNPQYFESVRNLISESERFKWEYVDLKNGNAPVPDAIDVMIIASTAQELTDREQYELDQFMMRGGRILAFYGLLDLNPGQPQMGIDRSWPAPHPSWARFLMRYHIKVGNRLVYDERCLIFTRGDSATPAPPVHFITSYPNHPINSGITISDRQMDPQNTSTYLFYPVEVNVLEEALPRVGGVAQVTSGTILMSSPRSWLRDVPAVFRKDPFAWTDPARSDYSPAVRDMRWRPQSNDGYRQYVTAASLAGTFASGFNVDNIPPKVLEMDEPPDFGGMNPFGGGDDNDGLQDGEQPPIIEIPGDPQTAPQTAPDQNAIDRKAFLSHSDRPTRMAVFGTTMLYPLDLNFGNTHQFLINSLDWLADNDDLLALKAKTSGRRPIDPTLGEGARDWFGWMVFLVVPLALVLVSLFLFVFGVQERWFLRARQQTRGSSGLPSTASIVTRATRDATTTIDREPGVFAMVVGLGLVAVLVVGWVRTGGFAGLWVLGLLLATAIIAKGAQILFENRKPD